VRRLRRLSGLVLVATTMLWVKAGYSEPGGCPACDTQYWANWSGCAFWSGHEHAFLGYWPYNGHIGYHTMTDCGDCSARHFTCEYAAVDAADSIRRAIESGETLKPVLARHGAYASLDREASAIKIRGCDEKVVAIIKLDRKQMSEFT
jgi:hypothetical protein